VSDIPSNQEVVLSDGHTTLAEALQVADEMHTAAEEMAECCNDSDAAVMSKGGAIIEMLAARVGEMSEEIRKYKAWAASCDPTAEVMHRPALVKAKANSSSPMNCTQAFGQWWQPQWGNLGAKRPTEGEAFRAGWNARGEGETTERPLAEQRECAKLRAIVDELWVQMDDNMAEDAQSGEHTITLNKEQAEHMFRLFWRLGGKYREDLQACGWSPPGASVKTGSALTISKEPQ
jgi:hypothetical protein